MIKGDGQEAIYARTRSIIIQLGALASIIYNSSLPKLVGRLIDLQQGGTCDFNSPVLHAPFLPFYCTGSLASSPISCHYLSCSESTSRSVLCTYFVPLDRSGDLPALCFSEARAVRFCLLEYASVLDLVSLPSKSSHFDKRENPNNRPSNQPSPPTISISLKLWAVLTCLLSIT
jgi:hypothetical protein